MNCYLIFAIYIFLINNKKTTAKELSKKFEVSQRSIYRYIDALSLLGVPITTNLGRNGGIELVGNHYFENFILNAKERQILKEFITNNKNIEEVKTTLSKLV